MGILDQYKKAVAAEQETNMELPSDYEGTLNEEGMSEYRKVLEKMRKGSFSEDEIAQAIKNSKKNMETLEEKHDGGSSEKNFTYANRVEKLTDADLEEKELTKTESVTDIRVIRAYCPKCGKELVAQAPPVYNPFTMEKMCIHECCGTKFNLDKPYPHIAYYGEDGNEIISFGL